MLHARPASCRVTAALSPAIPAPTIAICGMVLLLSKLPKTYEYEILILYHTGKGLDNVAICHNDWLTRFLAAERCDSMKNIYIGRGNPSCRRLWFQFRYLPPGK